MLANFERANLLLPRRIVRTFRWSLGLRPNSDVTGCTIDGENLRVGAIAAPKSNWKGSDVSGGTVAEKRPHFRLPQLNDARILTLRVRDGNFKAVLGCHNVTVA